MAGRSAWVLGDQVSLANPALQGADRVLTAESAAKLRSAEVNGPVGSTVEWDSEIVEDLPGERLAWKSVNGDVTNSGAVRFDDRDGAADMEYSIEFDPPGGKAGDVVAKLFDDPEDKVQRALDAFKHLVERDARPRGDSRAHVPVQEARPPAEAA